MNTNQGADKVDEQEKKIISKTMLRYFSFRENQYNQNMPAVTNLVEN